MKNILKIFTVLIFSTFILFSCNKIKDATDVTFDTSLTADLPIVVPPAAVREINGAFSESETIDPTSDPDIEKYLDNIKSYNIQSLTVTVTSISKDITLTNATFSCFNNSQNASWVYNNEPIFQGKVFTLSNTNGQFNTISSILMTGQVFTVSAVGTTDQDDVSFTLSVVINAEVTANTI